MAVLVGGVWSAHALGGPEGSRVTRGSGEITGSGANTVIRASDGAIIEHERFSIGRQESVQFVQPNAKARVLNRVTGGAASGINGALTANGIVYLVNPAGVMFGPGATVDVAGLYAAAGHISDGDFLSNRNRFTDLSGSVVNEGSIRGRAVMLAGRRVLNSGSIEAPDGMIALVAGDRVVLSEHGSGVAVEASADALNRRAAGDGSPADSGRSPRVNLGAGDMYSVAMRESGSLRASVVHAESAGGDVEVAGRVRAVRGEAGRGRRDGGDVR